MGDIKGLIERLMFHFLKVKMGAAGQVVYFDKQSNTIILGVHTTSPQKAQEIAKTAWESIPLDFKGELRDSGIGFAVKQI